MPFSVLNPTALCCCCCCCCSFLSLFVASSGAALLSQVVSKHSWFYVFGFFFMQMLCGFLLQIRLSCPGLEYATKKKKNIGSNIDRYRCSVKYIHIYFFLHHLKKQRLIWTHHLAFMVGVDVAAHWIFIFARSFC